MKMSALSFFSPATVLVLLVVGVGSMAGQAEARCGYPELPPLIVAPEELQHWVFFEEGQRMRLTCQAGPIGVAPWAGTTAAKPRFVLVGGAIDIECRGNQWNTTGLVCLRMVPMRKVLDRDSAMFSAMTSMTTNHEDAMPMVNVLFDDNVNTCKSIIEEQKSKRDTRQEYKVMLIDHKERLVFNRRFPRVALMVQRSNVTEMGLPEVEREIVKKSEAVMNDPNGNDTGATDAMVEVEESKSFLDFVYHQFVNQTEAATTAEKLQPMPTGGGGGSGDDDETTGKANVAASGKQFQLSDGRVVTISVELSVAEGGLQRRCHLNQDGTLQRSHGDVTLELLIFECPLLEHLVVDEDQANEITVNIVTSGTTNKDEVKRSNLMLCGLEAFVVADTDCGSPYIPIYGSLTTKHRAGGKDEVVGSKQELEAIYTCTKGYRIINITETVQTELALYQMSLAGNTSTALVAPAASGKVNHIVRTCGPSTSHRWSPLVQDIHCMPKVACRSLPAMVDTAKFYFEYARLDHLNRAIGGVSMATLRCQTLTEFVAPFTMYACGREGRWQLVTGRNATNPPECRPSFNGGRRGRYYHHYHYYQQSKQNHSSMLLFGRRLDDNKYLIYYGVAGLVILFGGSFIILFHVRRMAKKISHQMRERSYMSIEKSAIAGYGGNGQGGNFMTMDEQLGGGGGANQGYYGEADNNALYDSGTLFSNDLPPPTTPISMPTHLGANSNRKTKNTTPSLSNFDSIKY